VALSGIVVANVDTDAENEIMAGTLDFNVDTFEWSGTSCAADETMPWLTHEGEVEGTPQVFKDTSSGPTNGKFAMIVQDRGGRIVIYELSGTYADNKVQWRGFGNDAGRMGLYGQAGSLVEGDGPELLAIHPNHPNPFNPTTTITYDVGSPTHVHLAAYDAGGRMVRTLVDDWHERGHYLATWDGRDDRGHPLGSGVYFFRLRAGGVLAERRMVLLK